MKLKEWLYNDYKFWCYDGTIWVIGDTHFGDEDNKLMNPDWVSPDEQVKLINSCVGKHDTLVILGDVGDESYVKKLKGHKVLILGNHDKGVSNYKREEKYIGVDNDITLEEIRKEYPDFKSFVDISLDRTIYTDNGLFDEVYDGPLFIGSKVLLSHEPINIPFGYNIHGHTHGKTKFEHWANNNVSYCVCADTIGWKPVRLDKIISEFSGIKDIHRIAVDKAVGRNGK